MTLRPRYIAFPFAIGLASAGAAAQPCGMSPNDWCPAQAGDRCGRHATAEACRADSACKGVRYRGESLVRCEWDARNFAPNCPTVGCRSVDAPTD